ncbi:hypothetical protein SH467x_004417 [Pirellulaceae bacterium SH467]
MAVRLPVVLCQHPRRSGAHSEHEETWITRLLFEERLDATLVADLGTIPRDSTDQLCLEGFKGGFLLLSWQTAESVAEHLQRLGIAPIELIPVGGGPKIAIAPEPLQSESPASLPLVREIPSPKHVYYMHLDLQRSIDAGVLELKGLLASLSTPVFQLQSRAPAARGAPSAKTGVNTSGAPVSAANQDPQPMRVVQSALTPRQEPSQIAPPAVQTTRAVDSKMDEEFPNIDSLVRELDDFDL